jgi:acyl-CoA ligase (AMP-forming) (exosortase A-associated)
MPGLVYDLILQQAAQRPQAVALVHRQASLCYADLAHHLQTVAGGLHRLGLSRLERVAVYLPKRLETVCTLFGTALAGGVFVPINPLLKPEQVAHILKDCNVRILVTASDRATLLETALAFCHDLHTLVLVDAEAAALPRVHHLEVLGWAALNDAEPVPPVPGIDLDMAAILYTSGSTGKPKGVVLSHRNLVAGAQSVASYLGNQADDRLLAVLPLSFDAGLSQLTTAFTVGARAVLMDYLLPRDVINTVVREGVTGLTAVPPLWIQLAQLPWPPAAQQTLRYIANTGGHLPRTTLTALRQALPNTQPFLMYGLTEAFRSTYLPPAEVDRRPDSIGKAIPNAEILVVREDGTPCAPGEPGELVHRGSLVTLGYWNDPDKTAERFRPAPGQPAGLPLSELAVWSGDTVRMDEDGFIYFIARKDDMIKTSGYRVSPTEVEEVVYGSGLVAEAAAVGVPHPLLGQAIVAVVKPLAETFEGSALLEHCQRQLPNFMVPLQVVGRDSLPRNPNGKLDRKRLVSELQDLFQEQPA